MRAVAEYKGFSIVETDWTTSVQVGGAEELRPVFIIRGLKERPSRPFLTSVEECQRFIEDELRAREEVDEAMSETWGCRIRSNGRASVVTVPAETMRRLGLEIGDQVTVRISRRRGRTAGEKGNSSNEQDVPRRDGSMPAPASWTRRRYLKPEGVSISIYLSLTHFNPCTRPSGRRKGWEGGRHGARIGEKRRHATSLGMPTDRGGALK